MAARGFLSLLLFLGFCAVAQCLAATTVLTVEDQNKMKDHLMRSTPDDLPTLFHVVASLKLLSADITTAQDLCTLAKSKVESNSIPSIYYATSIAKLVGNCKITIPEAETTLKSAINDKSSTQTIRYAVDSLMNLGFKVDDKTTTDALKSILKAESEDFVPSATNTLFVATHLSGDVTFAFDLVEDAVAQADEIGEKYLQFEAGLKLTGDFISGVYALSEHIKKAPSLTEDQAVKFANYLLSRKYVQTPEDTYFLLHSLSTFANNQFHVPVKARLHGSNAISQNNKFVKVRVTNTLDVPFDKMTVVAVTVVDKDEEELCSNKAFKPEADFYQLDVMSLKPAAGFYKLDVSVKPEKDSKRLIGLTDIKLAFKVVTKVSIENVEISVVDKEHASLVNSLSLKYPNSLEKVLPADHHQKLTMTFSLTDQISGEAMTAHQTFVRFMNTETRQEIFFVAEPESNNVYKFDLDVGAAAKDSFASLSGDYQMDLLIGDGVIENALFWNVAVVNLKFAESSGKAKQERGSQFQAKPTIEHMFRQPEKRPPRTVSATFTILVLLPLLILLAGWLKLGANFSNFQFSISAIVFHIGLGSIFFLLYAFWTSLNMFSTLKYLALLGTITFLGGNSLLAGMAQQRTKN